MCFFYTVRGRRSGKGSCAGAPARSLQSGRLHSIAEPYESYQRTFPERIPHEQSWFRTRHRAPPARSGRYGPALETRRHRRAAALRQQCRENKCFGVSFRTPPTDSTGVAHILEHSVLCGSDKYPVKEPFVELLKGSLQTFLNAFTFPDKTCYPWPAPTCRTSTTSSTSTSTPSSIPASARTSSVRKLARGGRGHQGPLDLQGRGLQ